jgi:hypothetical protein
MVSPTFVQICFIEVLRSGDIHIIEASNLNQVSVMVMDASGAGFSIHCGDL